MTMDIFRDRRSIRKYEDRPVEDEKLQAVLEAACLAPSWANQQCWSFIVIKDQAKRQQISSILGNNPSAKAVAIAPITIVACARPDKSGNANGQDYYMLDIGISFQQLCLEAHNQGLGTVWIGWFDEARLRETLEAPEGIRIVALTPLGYPATKPAFPGRRPVEESVFYEKWSGR
jgi:nitroreductase